MTTDALHRTQIYLQPSQQGELAALASTLGSSSSALIREAIDAFLAGRRPEQLRAKRLGAAGQWVQNTEFDLAALRREERLFGRQF